MEITAGLDAALTATRTAQAALGAVVVSEFASAPAGSGPPLRQSAGKRPEETGAARQAASSAARVAAANTARPTATGGGRPPH